MQLGQVKFLNQFIFTSMRVSNTMPDNLALLDKNDSFSHDHTGDLAEGTGDILDLASSTNELIDSFFGEEKPTEPSKTNILPQFRKFLADQTGIPFDFCDKPATTPEPTCSLGGGSNIKVDLIPDRIPYGQTAQYTLTYCDSKKRNRQFSRIT